MLIMKLIEEERLLNIEPIRKDDDLTNTFIRLESFFSAYKSMYVQLIIMLPEGVQNSVSVNLTRF